MEFKTAIEKRNTFKVELIELLKKYKVGLNVDIKTDTWGYHIGSSIIAEFEYDENLGIVDDILFGNYIPYE